MAIAIGNLPEIRNQRCVRYRFRYSPCSRCADSCPQAALAPSDEGVSLDASRCSGCGLCQAACPSAAFHLPSFPVAALTKPQEKALSVVCSPSGQEGDVRIPCLGAIDPALLASLALRGIAVTLRGTDQCAKCAHAPHGGERVGILQEAMQELAEIAPSSWSAPVVEKSGAAQTGHRAERRQLFRRFSNLAVESLRREEEEETVPESAIRAGAHFVPARRRLAERLLEQLDTLAEESLLPMLFDIAALAPGTGQCTGCEACARVCPTGALKIAENQSDWILQFSAGQCVGCGVCIEACGADALALHYRRHPEGEMPAVLQALRRYRCQGCGRFFVGLKEEECPVCEDDQSSFEAIFG